MKNLTLAIFLFLVIGCKKDEQPYTSILLLTEPAYIESSASGSAATLRGSIFAPPSGSLNLKDHGFKVIDSITSTKIDTIIIPFGPRQSIGQIEYVLNSLNTTSKYSYYIYVIDQYDNYKQGKTNLIMITGQAL